MKKERLQSVSVAEEIDRLVARHEEISRIYRTRAMDPFVSNRADLLQVADYLSEKGKALREQAHRYGPEGRLELIVTATARLESARVHLARIDRGVPENLEAKKVAA